MLPIFPLLTHTNLLLVPLLPIHNRMDKEGMEEGMKEEEVMEEEEQRREAIMPIQWLHPSVVLQLMEELLLLLLPLPLLRKLEQQGLQGLQEEEVQLLELLLVSYPPPPYSTVTHCSLRCSKEDSCQETSSEEGTGQARNQKGSIHYQGRKRG